MVFRKPSTIMRSVLTLLTALLMLGPAAPAQTAGAVFYVAYIDVQVSSTNQVIALTKQYREASRTERGNSGVDVMQESSRQNRFVIMEGWKDQSSFEAHEKAPHTAQFRARISAIHNSPNDQRVHHEFAIDPRPPASGPDTVFVVTHVDVPPQRKDATEVLLKALAEESRKDQGNVRYDVFQQNAGTNHFTILAAWKDRNTFDSYEMQKHTRQFREALAPMLGAPYDERLYNALN